MKRILAIMMSLALLITAFSGCSTQKTKPQNGTIKILMMPKLIGIPWFNASDDGAKKAAQKLGVELIYTGPTTPDAAEQVKMIEDYLTKDISAVCIAPNDPNAIKPVLNMARDKGILVMDWDTPADINDVNYSVQSVDPVVYGETLWDYLVKAMGTDEGEYAILTGGLEAAGLNAWIEAGRKHAEEKYPNLSLVTEPIATNEQQQEAYTKTLDLIKTYPNLKGIVAVSTPAPIGVAQAIQEKGLQDKIAVVGGVLPNDSNQYLKDKSLDYGVVEANPEMLGYATVYVAAMNLKGETIETGTEIPGLGKITLDSNGKTIILGDPLIIDANNVDNYNF